MMSKVIPMSTVTIGIGAKAAGGVTVVDFNDIKTSEGYYFKSGSLDLKVSNSVSTSYEDPDLLALFEISNAYPCCSRDDRFDSANDGHDFQDVPYLYPHIKNLACCGIATIAPELTAEIAATPIGELADGTQAFPFLNGVAKLEHRVSDSIGIELLSEELCVQKTWGN